MSANTTLVGNVTRDPELKFTNAGAAVVGFGLAVNRRWQDGTGEWQEEVSFFDVVAWRELAENIGDSIAKGDRVVVVGRLQQRTWENDDGDKRSKVEVVADDVGPSLRWAVAEVTKKERADDAPARSSGRGRGGSRSESRRSGDSDGGSGNRRESRRRAAEPDYAEEPF
jgi:single-strand DNA-binding protein